MAKRPSAKARAPREVDVRPERPPAGIPVARRVRLAGVMGQDRAVGNLRKAIGSGRLHHAWIFEGPPGVGKFTAALGFAGAILDPTTAPGLSGEIEPEEGSPTQRLLEAGGHPDLHIITKELAAVSRERGVRESKQRTIAKDVLDEFLIEPAARTSASRGGLAAKVFIIDEAELIDARGQNALLKTLEEPAAGSVIIMVTSHGERLLPTIRSRCQRVAFCPLAEEDMQRWLRGSGLDLTGLEKEDRAWLLSFAEGSPGMATLALETGLVGWRRAIAPMLAEVERGRFPLGGGAAMAKLAEEWAQAWVDRPGHEGASKDAANKAAYRQLFRLLAHHYRGGLRAGGSGGAGGVERPLLAIDLIQEAEGQVASNVAGEFVLENLTAQLARGE
jgi:DNA polymerase-3 subunit delta'